MKITSRIASTLLLLALMFSLMPAETIHANAATCYWAQFVADVTIPDGTNFAAGTPFAKTWRIRNIGSCAWNSNDVSLVFDSGETMGAPASSALPTSVNPGQTVDITLNLTAPAAAGHYLGYYKFKSASGGVFGIGTTANKSFWVEIKVLGAPTTNVALDFIADAGKATWSSGAGALPFPGTDGDQRGFSLTGLHWVYEDHSSPNSSMLVGPQNIPNGYIEGKYPEFTVQKGDVFQTQVGCELSATSCYVQFRLAYQIGNSSAPITLFQFNEKWEGLTKPASYRPINLDFLAGQKVTFYLGLSAYGSPIGDRAIWADTVITRPGGVPPPPPPTITGTPPTPTSTPQVTPMPNACDRAQFVADVTVPDGTSFAPGYTFNKTWRLRNIGTCTWTNYSLYFESGEKMGGPDSALIPTTVAPGQTVDITVPLTSPTTAGTYRGNWKLKSNTGVPFGLGTAGTKAFWVEIKVSGTGIVPNTPSTPVTPTTPGPSVTPSTPSAGTSYDFAANVCTAKWYSGAGELPCPGTDGDAKGFVLITNPSKLENGATDSRTGILTYPQNINNGYIQGIYPVYTVKPGDRFRSLVNCEFNATSCYVVFRLDYSLNGSSTVQTFWAFVEKYEGAIYSADIDLSALAGKDVKFILTVLSTGSPVGDRALWVSPFIYNPAAVPPTATNTSQAPSNTPTFTPTVTATPTFTETPTATATP